MDIVEFEPVAQRISVLAASGFAVSLYKWLEHFKTHSGAAEGDPIFHPVVAFGIVLCLAAIVHSWTEFLLYKLPMRMRYSRSLLSTTASIEGYWFQRVHSGSNPFSVICIEFDVPTGSYRYHGTNYLEDGTVNAHFESVQTSVHASGSGLTFNFDAAVLRRNFDQRTVDTDAARGYGRISFTADTGRGYVLGRGEFFETNPTANWRTFELYKIPAATVAKALGNRTRAVDDLDYSSLLMQVLVERAEKQTNLDSALSGIGGLIIKAQHGVLAEAGASRSQLKSDGG